MYKFRYSIWIGSPIKYMQDPDIRGIVYADSYSIAYEHLNECYKEENHWITVSALRIK